MATAGDASGLTTKEAEELLRRYGANEVAEEREHPLRTLAAKFWAPVPWMLEAAVVLELALGRRLEAAVIGGLLAFNAGLSFFQESHAQRALKLLRQRLTIQARVRRDGEWKRIGAAGLVPGDVIRLRVGDMAAADARFLDGGALVDHSAVTGESSPVEAEAGGVVYAGGMIRRGEATAVVTATGSRTYFGKTAELVREAKAAGHLQAMIFTVVRYLVACDVVLAAVAMGYALRVGMGWADVLPFCLMLLVASIPVALPATFTLASALGTQELARRGVLVSRLSAIEEAAAMDVLATDKTGTLTENELSVAEVTGEGEAILWAALASEAATQDPIDLAILAECRRRGFKREGYRVRKFVPFDPATKCSEAEVENGGRTFRVVKGAPDKIAAMTGEAVAPETGKLAEQGYRVLAVAAGPDGGLRTVGAVALLDPPRKDSRDVVARLGELGVRVLMVTGDVLATARTLAAQVGIAGAACEAERLRADPGRAAVECGLIAGVFPEDKFRLVRALQAAGHVVGMTGDGVNDAAALKQAEAGFAVANATDVAKAAASIVLTSPGLSDVPRAVETSRRIYQRMLTYTLNKIIKTLEVALFLTLGVMLGKTLVVTPVMIVLLLFTNDFVTMSIATDRVGFSRRPDRWQIRPLVMTAAPLAGLLVVFSLSVVFAGRNALGLTAVQVQTLAFLTLVFGGQGTVYLIRERGAWWRSRPSTWMLASTAADVALVGWLAYRGVLMAALPAVVIGGLMAAVALYLAAVDPLKRLVFRRSGLT